MKKIFLIVTAAGLVLAACSSAGATPTPTAPAPVTDNSAVLAEGRLAPIQFANLAFSTGGKVEEVLVQKGQTVQADAVIARLENSVQLKAQVTQAEAEALNAQQAIDTLNRNVDLARAKAQMDIATFDKALDDAQRRLRNIDAPDIKWYQDQVQKAQDALTTAQENVTVVDIGSLQASLQAAKDAQEKLVERWGKVKAAVDGCPTCDPTGAFTVDHFSQTLQHAQDDVNDGENRIKTLEIQIAQAQRGNSQTIKDAQKNLDDRVRDLNSAKAGGKPVDLEVAEANVTMAQANKKDAQDRLAKLQSGPDPDQLASAQARLAAAQAALAAAQDALKHAELRAPFAGVVADLKVKVGEQAAPGQTAVVLADFSQWIVETDDLTEIQVVKVAVGQQATLVLDALPEVTLHGAVTAISPLYIDNRGDVNYTVTVKLSDSDPKMRWGMKGQTTFGK